MNADVNITLGILVLLALEAHAQCPSGCRCHDNYTRVRCTGHIPLLDDRNISNYIIQLTLEFPPSIEPQSDRNINITTMESSPPDNSVKLNNILSNDLPRLENLTFINMNLSSFPISLLNNVKTLKNIKISGTNLTAFSTAGNSEVHRILAVLNSSQSDNVKDSSLTNEITTLDISNNKIHTMKLFNLKHLLKLDVSRNKLESLEASWDDSFIKLLSLNVSHNQITAVSSATFNSFIELHTLDLSHNSISHLSTDTFSMMKNLKILNLNNNPIGYLKRGLFDDLVQLSELSISNMPRFSHMPASLFSSLGELTHLKIRYNPKLLILHPYIFKPLKNLKLLDIRHNGLSDIINGTLTLHNSQTLQIFLAGNKLLCRCSLTWITILHYIADLDLVYCYNVTSQSYIRLNEIGDPSRLCDKRSAKIRYKLGEMVRIQCNNCDAIIGDVNVEWMTPQYNISRVVRSKFNRIDNLSAVLNSSSTYHLNHPWHGSPRYWTEFEYTDRISILNDGSLFIEYITYEDAGFYHCSVTSEFINETTVFEVILDYSNISMVTATSMWIGCLAALCVLILALGLHGLISLAKYSIELRKRYAVKKILESLDSYKTLQLLKLRELRAYQLGRFRDQYHHQLDRLRDQYHHQLDRIRDQYHMQWVRLRDHYNQHTINIRENCATQMDKLRDSYVHRLGRVMDYSTNRLERIRENYRTQIVRIRDYGSQQMEKLRESYRVQQNYLLRILDSMNIENCRSPSERGSLDLDLTEPTVIILHKGEQVDNISMETDDTDYATAPDTNDFHSVSLGDETPSTYSSAAPSPSHTVQISV